MRAEKDRQEFEARLKRKEPELKSFVLSPLPDPVHILLPAVGSSDLTVSDLRALAREKGVENYSTLCKAELMRAVFDE